MSNIFYAWELGANLGHIGAFLPLARLLRERQHNVQWVVAHPHQASRVLPSAGFDWLQAPQMPEVRKRGAPINYADILLRFGYAQPQDLFGLVVAWRKLMGMLSADIVLADHAPTAILAARTLGLPVMLCGSSFFTPPAIHPTPNMRPWLAVSEEQLLVADSQVLVSMNTILNHFGKTSVSRVADLFQVEEQALLTFPELDHYENRASARYWGTLPYSSSVIPDWPATTGPKIFAYLRPNSAHFEAALNALHQLDGCILIFAPGIGPQMMARYSSNHLRFLAEPVDLALAASQADAALTYASPAVTIAFLLAGKPVVMLPGHLEQSLFAFRVAQLGAGLAIDPDKPADELPTVLRKILGDISFLANAQAFAEKYASFSQEKLLALMVQRIEEIASNRSASFDAR